MTITTALKKFFLCFSIGILLNGCGADGGSGGSGSLSTSLIDSTTDEYRAVYVTIERIEVHIGDGDVGGGGWLTVAEPEQTYDLLELVNGNQAALGFATLDTGHYTQMRLYIGDTPSLREGDAHPYANYAIDLDDTVHELKIPSSAIKLVKRFDIIKDRTTGLILDFDAQRSVVKAGSSGQYLLKPTIKVLDTEENALIAGVVDDAEGPLEGAGVTAQKTDIENTEVMDQVVIHAGTLTDVMGGYMLYLDAGDYNVVAYRDGYEPQCQTYRAAMGSTGMVDFQLPLQEVDPGTVSGTLSVAGATEEQVVTVVFRLVNILCGDSSQDIVVKSLEIANGGSYSVELPLGTYRVVAATAGAATQWETIEVTANSETDKDFDFL